MNINTLSNGYIYGNNAIQNGIKKLNTVSSEIATNQGNTNQIEENAVKLLEAKEEVKAGAKVITAQDEAIGSLLDILA